MYRGYVKLWRKTKASRIFQSEGLLKVWIWCLLKANHKKAWVSIKIGRGETEVHLDPGQFIYGRKSAAKELKMKPSSVRNRIEKLKNIGNLDTQQDTHYTIITIKNWDVYQKKEKKEDTKEDRQRTGKGQAKDTDKNVENVENVKKGKTFCENSIEFSLSKLLLGLILLRNSNHKKPDLQKWAVHIDRAIRLDGRTPDELKAAVEWCQSDSFWQNNILSTAKLREQYDQLFLKMNSPKAKRSKGGLVEVNGRVVSETHLQNIKSFKQAFDDTDQDGNIRPGKICQ